MAKKLTIPKFKINDLMGMKMGKTSGGTPKTVQFLAGIGLITLATVIVPLVVGLVMSAPDIRRYVRIRSM